MITRRKHFILLHWFVKAENTAKPILNEVSQND